MNLGGICGTFAAELGEQLTVLTQFRRSVISFHEESVSVWQTATHGVERALAVDRFHCRG
jgi:hypothetical protein